MPTFTNTLFRNSRSILSAMVVYVSVAPNVAASDESISSAVDESVSGDDAEALFNLDLSNLMDLEMITVVSKREESLYSASGVVTVVTREEIKRYGARHTEGGGKAKRIEEGARDQE